MKHAEWLADGKARFGADPADWQYRCISCGELYSGADYVERGQPAAGAAQGCIGRLAGGKQAVNILGFRPSRPTAPGGRGCDYACFGLIPWPGLVEVEMSDGSTILAMPFAEKVLKARATTRQDALQSQTSGEAMKKDGSTDQSGGGGH